MDHVIEEMDKVSGKFRKMKEKERRQMRLDQLGEKQQFDQRQKQNQRQRQRKYSRKMSRVIEAWHFKKARLRKRSESSDSLERTYLGGLDQNQNTKPQNVFWRIVPKVHGSLREIVPKVQEAWREHSPWLRDVAGQILAMLKTVFAVICKKVQEMFRTTKCRVETSFGKAKPKVKQTFCQSLAFMRATFKNQEQTPRKISRNIVGKLKDTKSNLNVLIDTVKCQSVFKPTFTPGMKRLARVSSDTVIKAMNSTKGTITQGFVATCTYAQHTVGYCQSVDVQKITNHTLQYIQITAEHMAMYYTIVHISGVRMLTGGWMLFEDYVKGLEDEIRSIEGYKDVDILYRLEQLVWMADDLHDHPVKCILKILHWLMMIPDIVGVVYTVIYILSVRSMLASWYWMCDFAKVDKYFMAYLKRCRWFLFTS